MDYPSFFCSGDWLKASAEVLLPKDELFILSVQENHSIKGILPLVKRPNRLGGIGLFFLGPDFNPDP